MANALKYMIDENGDKTSVLVPLKTWEKINQDYSKLQNKLKVLTGIKEGLAEVRGAKKSGKNLQNLKTFSVRVTVKITKSFTSAAKPLLKQYNSLSNDLLNLEKQLIATPGLGTSLG